MNTLSLDGSLDTFIIERRAVHALVYQEALLRVVDKVVVFARRLFKGAPMRSEIAQESLKAAPPVAVTAWAWMSGLDINQVVGYATLLYIVLQAGYLIWKWVREVRRGK